MEDSAWPAADGRPVSVSCGPLLAETGDAPFPATTVSLPEGSILTLGKLAVSIAAGLACFGAVKTLVWDPKDWQGTTSDYVALVIAAGGAVIAAAPTARAALSHWSSDWQPTDPWPPVSGLAVLQSQPC